jgi:hypothetical protein
MDTGALMAGLLFVYALWLSPLILLACGLIGGFLARNKSRRARMVFPLVGVLTPIIIVFYLSDMCWILGAIGEMSGNDFGFSDRFDLILQNNYCFSAMDSTTDGLVYAAKEPVALQDIPETAPNTFWNVRQIQEEGDWLAGYEDGGSRESSYDKNGPFWFLFNTRTKARFNVKNERDLEVIAASHGLRLKLEPSDVFYVNHRFGVTDCLTLLELFLPWIVLFGTVLIWFLRG